MNSVNPIVAGHQIPNDASCCSNSSSNVTSSASSAAADEKYNFTAFCIEEEKEIAAARGAICSLVEATVDLQLAAVGPIAGEGSVVVASSGSGDDTSATKTTVSTVAQQLTVIGDAISRERSRIHTTALRQHRKYLLAKQCLGGGPSTTSTTKSRAKAAMNAKKRLNESSDFVENVAAAVSLSGILKGKHSSVDYVCSNVSTLVLEQLAAVMEKAIGVPIIAINGNNGKAVSESPTSSSKAAAAASSAAATLASMSDVTHRVASKVSIGAGDICKQIFGDNTTAPHQTAAEGLFHKAITTLRSQQVQSLRKAPPSTNTHCPPLSSVADLSEALQHELNLTPFAAFTLGKELFLQYRQEYAGALLLTTPATAALPSDESAAGSSLLTAKEAVCRLLAAFVLLNHAANTVVNPNNNNGAITAHVDAVVGGGDTNNSDMIPQTDEPSSAAASRVHEKPSFLTPHPKPLFAGDAFYYLGCCVKSIEAAVAPLTGLITAAAASPSSKACTVGYELAIIAALFTEWVPFQVPAAIVALSNRAMDRFEAQEEAKEAKQQQTGEDADGEEEGNLTFPHAIDTRDDSDDIFVKLLPTYCAMQCLSVNEGNHSGAWQLLAEGLSTATGDCVEIGDPKMAKANATAGPNDLIGAGAAAASSSNFLRGGGTAFGGVGASLFGGANFGAAIPAGMINGGTTLSSPLSAAQQQQAASSWEGSVYVGEHTKTSAYVESIRCLGGVTGCTHPLHLNTIWLPLAQSMFYSSNPDIGAEEVLIPCYDGTWFDEPEAEVCKLDKKQILSHIIAVDRVACPEAYLELGAMANMGYVFSERDCKHCVLESEKKEGAVEEEDIFADDSDDDTDDAQLDENGQPRPKKVVDDAAKKRAAEAKAAFRAAKSTTNDALVTLVEDVLEAADEYLPEDNAPIAESGIAPCVDLLYRQYLGTLAPATIAAGDVDRAMSLAGRSKKSKKTFQMLLSNSEEAAVTKHSTKLKLRVVREEVSVVDFRPIVKPRKAAAAAAASAATEGASSTTCPTAAAAATGETLSGITLSDSNKKAGGASEPNADGEGEVVYPRPLSLRKMDCFALSLSLAPRNAKAWVKLALGLEDKPLCKAKEAISMLEAGAEVAKRLLAVNEAKRRYFEIQNNQNSNNSSSNGADLKLSKRQWQTTVFPAIVNTFSSSSPPFAISPATALQCDPLVYARDVLSDVSSSSSSSSALDGVGTISRVEALMRALSCDKGADSRTWFIIGTTLAERQMLKESCAAEAMEAARAERSGLTSAASSSSSPQPLNFMVSIGAKLAAAKAEATKDDALSAVIRLPTFLLPAAHPRAATAAHNDDGAAVVLVPLTAADCLRVALLAADVEAVTAPSAAKSTRTMVMQWCRKNNFAM